MVTNTNIYCSTVVYTLKFMYVDRHFKIGEERHFKIGEEREGNFLVAQLALCFCENNCSF